MDIIEIPPNASFLEALEIIRSTNNVDSSELLARLFAPATKINSEEVPCSSSITLEEAFALHQNYPHFLDMSPESQKSYRITLRQLVEFLGPSTLLNSLEPWKIEDFLISFDHGKHAGTKFSERSFNRKLYTVRAFFDAMICLKKLNGPNITKDIKRKKEPKNMPDYLTQDQQRLALNYAREGVYGTRDFTILLFALNTGAREEGIININWEDIEFKNGYLWLDEKGSKRRKIPMRPDFADQLRYYRANYSDAFKGKRTGPVFLTMSGGKFKRITNDALRSVMERIFRKLELNDSRLHRLRRTFALNCLEGGKGKITLNHIKELLGHASISTTVIYLQLDDEELLKTMEECFPNAVASYRHYREMSDPDGDDGNDENEED